MIDDPVQALLAHPRSFLLAHIAPLLPRHPQVAAFVAASSRVAQRASANDYPKVLEAHGIRLRPDWPPERLTLAVQIILDGTLIRSRIEPDSMPASRWRTGSIYADTVLSLVAGAIDVDADGRTTRQWLDYRIHRAVADARTSSQRLTESDSAQ